MPHNPTGSASSRGPSEPVLSARGWRRLRRAVSIGVFGVATVLAVVVGSQGATTSPVAAATPVADAAATVGPPAAAARDVGIRPQAGAETSRQGHERRRR